MRTAYFSRIFLAPNALVIWLAYFIAAASLLLQLPLQGSLPGHWDSWLYLGLFNYYADYFLAFVDGSAIYTAFYPAQFPNFFLGEPSAFNALLYLPIQYLTGDPIWSFYLFISLLLSLNAWGLFLIFRQLSGHHWGGFLAGSFLMFSNYMLCSLDQQNVLSIYPALLSCYAVLRYKADDGNLWIVVAAIMAGVQLYCSAYHFFFLFLVFSVLCILEFGYFLRLLRRSLFWVAIGIVILFALPFVHIYLFGDLHEQTHNFVGQATKSSLSLHFTDWFKVHPYNLIYGAKQDKNLLHYIHAVGPGLALICLAVTGWWGLTSLQLKRTFAFLIIVALFIAWGPIWQVASIQISSPVYLLIDGLMLEDLMRTPVRAYMIVLVVANILAAFAIIQYWAKYRGLLICLIAFWMLENIPYRLQQYNSIDFIRVPAAVIEAAELSTEAQPLWILPSALYEYPGLPVGLGEQNREYIYMFWQTRFKKNMVNGMNAYVPYLNWSVRKSKSKPLLPTTTVYIDGMEIGR